MVSWCIVYSFFFKKKKDKKNRKNDEKRSGPDVPDFAQV